MQRHGHPYSTGKYSDFEGGIRTNAFISGGFIPATSRGTRYSGVMSIADWYGVFCELVRTSSQALTVRMTVTTANSLPFSGRGGPDRH
jgi:hypothetical protein